MTDIPEYCISIWYYGLKQQQQKTNRQSSKIYEQSDYWFSCSVSLFAFVKYSYIWIKRFIWSISTIRKGAWIAQG